MQTFPHKDLRSAASRRRPSFEPQRSRLRLPAKRILVVVLIGCALSAAGCRQEMASQPSYRPLKPSAFFADGRSARPLIEGTVARGELRSDRAYYTGRASGVAASPEEAAGLIAAPGLPAAGALAVSAQKRAYIDYLPFPQKEMGQKLARGQERFNIYCAVCHGRDGDGEGMIPQRGFTKPPNFHTDKSRLPPQRN
jgi:mono/diheme cytochrome c family protein